jgi:hypothetical protein
MGLSEEPKITVNWPRLAVGATLIGIGVAYLLSSMHRCTTCGEAEGITTPEESATVVAAASAEMNGSGHLEPIDDPVIV